MRPGNAQRTKMPYSRVNRRTPVSTAARQPWTSPDRGARPATAGTRASWGAREETTQARKPTDARSKLDVSTPIIDETYALLYEGKEPRQAVRDLMARAFKAED